MELSTPEPKEEIDQMQDIEVEINPEIVIPDSQEDANETEDLDEVSEKPSSLTQYSPAQASNYSVGESSLPLLSPAEASHHSNAASSA